MPKSKVDFSKFSKSVQRNADKIIHKNALEFHSNIVEAYPVDTGHAMHSWEAPKKVAPMTYEVRNNVKYAHVLWLGRSFRDGQMRGSEQMPNGGYPIWFRTQRKIANDLKGL